MASDTIPANYITPLRHLQQAMQEHYALFQSGFISEKEYLSSIKPLDEAIDTLEISMLKEFLAAREASSTPFHVPGKQRVTL